MTVTHTLKSWPASFQPIRRKQKNFDVRRDDRGFQKGDVVVFREWQPPAKEGYTGNYTGNEEHRRIKYILTGGQFGIEPGYVVLGF